MFKLNAKFDADSLLYSVILNVRATQYMYSINCVYCPHWLVEWSLPLSCLHVLVHSPWLSGYINVTQTILIMLIMVGFLQDRPCLTTSLGLSSIQKFKWYSIRNNMSYTCAHTYICKYESNFNRNEWRLWSSDIPKLQLNADL